MDAVREQRLRPKRLDIWLYPVTVFATVTLQWMSVWVKRGSGLSDAFVNTVSTGRYWVILSACTICGALVPWLAYWAAALLPGIRGKVQGRDAIWKRSYMSDLITDTIPAVTIILCLAIICFRNGDIIRTLRGSAYGFAFLAFVTIKQVINRYLWREEKAKALDSGDYSSLNDERNRAVQSKADQSTLNMFLIILLVGGCLYEYLVQGTIPARTLIEIWIILSLRQLLLAHWNRKL